MTVRFRALLCSVFVCLFATSLFAQTHKIDFEELAGPSRFDRVQSPVHSLSATFSGGEVLRNSTLNEVTRSAVYGTSSECAGCSPEITVGFHQRVANVEVAYHSAQQFEVRYTTEGENGELHEHAIPTSFAAGAGIISLSDKNIREIILSNSAPDFVMTVNAVTFAATAGPVLVDPVVANLLSGSAVTTNTATIAAATTGLVQGVAADGTTQAILRMPATTSGKAVTVKVINDAGSPSTSVANDGGVFALGASPTAAASSLSVNAVSTAQGVEAFALYLGPANFSRGTSADNAAKTRTVTLQTTPSGGTASNTAVTIARPPVILIHGLWGNASSFNNFTPLTTSTIFSVNRAVYANTITGITSTTPSFSSSVTSAIAANSLGFAYNAPGVLSQINNFISSYRTTANVAAVQADVVAHSMGGDISRTMVLLSTFPAANTYGAGPINKLITISTPHLGTPVAADLLASNNSCARNVLASDGDVALQSITFSGTTTDGAVLDLEGNGFGSSLSTALTNLKPAASQPFRTSYIAGIATSTNLKGLSCIFCNAEALRLICSGNPLASDLTASKWPTIYGQNNDTIVPVDSSLNNLTGLSYSGVIHTAALETLNFNGPSVLDPASGISNEVISLLNEPPTGTDFH